MIPDPLKPRANAASWRERLTLRALRGLIGRGEAPSWLRGARYSSNPEDAQGLDVVVDTDSGEFFLQVLSEKTSVTSWLAKYPPRPRVGILRVHKRSVNRPDLVGADAVGVLRTLRRGELGETPRGKPQGCSWCPEDACQRFLDHVLCRACHREAAGRYSRATDEGRRLIAHAEREAAKLKDEALSAAYRARRAAKERKGEEG